MSAYTDAAPLLSTAVGVTKFKSDNPKPVAPVVAEDEQPIKAKIAMVYNALLTMENTGIGYSGVSRLTGVSRRWVRRIHREMNAAKSVVYAATVEPR